MTIKLLSHLGSVALLVVAAISANAAKGSQSQPTNGVPSVLLSKLNRGVNITRWFGYVKADDTELFKNYLTDADIANFKKLKVTYVRLCLAPEVIYREGTPDVTNLRFIDGALAKLEKAGMAVLWDLHDNGQMKLDAPDHDNSGFIKFWQSIASHYKGKSEESVVFELLNEPIFQKNPDVWYKLQAKTVAAIREIDPNRTMLVASTGWNGIDTLLSMKPLEEKNLIYSFHCYDPFTFTHQGASWAGDFQKSLTDIPFPSSPEAVDAIIKKIPEASRAGVIDYGTHRYDATYLRQRLESCVQWGNQNRVPVLLGEFGAYPPVAPAESRGRWFEAMASAIKEFNLPNCLWGYDDALGLGRDKAADGTIHLDPVTLGHFYHLELKRS